MTVMILEAADEADFARFAAIIVEYFDWLRRRYSDQPWLIDKVASAQSLDEELAELSAQYARPRGVAFLVEVDGALAGAGAWRSRTDGSCEMKRVFIRNAFQGRGAGRRLCEAIMQSARDHDYALMRLDTGRRMTEAQGLYARLGFAACEPYQEYPADVLSAMEFMQARL
jgi:GNAT superfamily N-acetyltransferase